MTPRTLDNASREHMPRDVLVRHERRALLFSVRGRPRTLDGDRNRTCGALADPRADA
jgi:hypothetical protein